MSLFATSKGI